MLNFKINKSSSPGVLLIEVDIVSKNDGQFNKLSKLLDFSKA